VPAPARGNAQGIVGAVVDVGRLGSEVVGDGTPVGCVVVGEIVGDDVTVGSVGGVSVVGVAEGAVGVGAVLRAAVGVGPDVSDEDVTVVVEPVESGSFPVSGLTQFSGGVAFPAWPGIRTVPAQPISERVAVSTTVPPSEKVVVATAFRM
jgi:hypothetical protein